MTCRRGCDDVLARFRSYLRERATAQSTSRPSPPREVAKRGRRRPARVGTGLVGVLGYVLANSVHAVELSDRLTLHGFGQAGYVWTSDNRYHDAAPGEADRYDELALLLTARVNERSNAWVLVHNMHDEVRVDWAFVDYQVARGPTLRLGQIKLPMGIYNETRDMAYTRPSSLKPLLYEEASEILDEAYRGIGAVYDQDVGGGRLSWDVFAGRLVESGLGEHRYRDLVGGRVTYHLPAEGWRAMVSANRTGAENVESGASGHYTTWVGSIDYAQDAWDLKAEYGTKSGFGLRGDSWYGQAAYTFGERWTPYVRYDVLTTDRTRRNLPSFHQESVVVGIGYRLNDYVAFRLETHRNDGYALAVAAREIAEGRGTADWHMATFSISFIF